jgi:hypothetical protein
MAITRVETQVTWSNSPETQIQLSAGGSASSTEFNLDATCVKAQISLKADLPGVGSPAAVADDIIHFWLRQTSGDPDGSGTDEFDRTDALHLARLDLFNDGSPNQVTVSLPLPQKGCILYAEGVTAGTTHPINVSATVTEQRAA